MFKGLLLECLLSALYIHLSAESIFQSHRFRYHLKAMTLQTSFLTTKLPVWPQCVQNQVHTHTGLVLTAYNKRSKEKKINKSRVQKKTVQNMSARFITLTLIQNPGPLFIAVLIMLLYFLCVQDHIQVSRREKCNDEFSCFRETA
jgi:hypothetical protein